MSFLSFRACCAALLLAFLSACVSTQTVSTTNDFDAIRADAVVLLMEPDVQLSLLGASGMREVRADWTQTGKANVLAEIEKYLGADGHQLVEHVLNPENPREHQLIKLHEAVGTTLLYHRIFRQPLPSKKDKNDWSLGPGVQTLVGETQADYALFLYARGAYATAGRQVLAIGLALAGGGGVGTGDQQAFASLVDLKTGDIVWFNVATTGQGTDMRKPEGSTKLVKAILKGFPLSEGGK
ncbi:MAG: hypothetical protein V3V30_01760 [Parvularculaceae bacterium]